MSYKLFVRFHQGNPVRVRTALDKLVCEQDRSTKYFQKSLALIIRRIIVKDTVVLTIIERFTMTCCVQDSSRLFRVERTTYVGMLYKAWRSSARRRKVYRGYVGTHFNLLLPFQSLSIIGPIRLRSYLTMQNVPVLLKTMRLFIVYAILLLTAVYDAWENWTERLGQINVEGWTIYHERVAMHNSGF